jgi:methionyl-tRNA formyltransferase
VETTAFINRIKPDLLMISGTSIVKKDILGLAIPYGIINLHTGLSPYVKGGPNCTNWCIAENKMHLIGNTVMWVDAGTDSGDLITTSLTDITGDETLLELHIKVMEHAHKIYLDAVQKIQDDKKNCPRVKQSTIAAGTVYYNKQWNWKAKYAMMKNLKKMPAYFHSEQYRQDKKNITTVPL